MSIDKRRFKRLLKSLDIILNVKNRNVVESMIFPVQAGSLVEDPAFYQNLNFYLQFKNCISNKNIKKNSHEATNSAH